MATTYYPAAGTGSKNWSDGTAWSTSQGGAAGSTAPTASDDVIIEGKNGTHVYDIVVDSATACLAKTLTVQNVASSTNDPTLTFTAGKKAIISGSITIGTSYAGLSGTGELVCHAAGALTTNGVTIPCALTYNATGTYTIVGVTTVTGIVYITTTAVINWTTNITTDYFNLSGGLWLYGNTGTTGTSFAKMNFVGACTIAGGGYTIYNPINFNYAGNITLASDITCNGTVTWTLATNLNCTSTIFNFYCGKANSPVMNADLGTDTTNANAIIALVATGALTSNAHTIYNQLNFGGGGITLTISGAAIVQGLVSITQTCTINYTTAEATDTITCNGGLYCSSTPGSGSAKFVIGNTGTVSSDTTVHYFQNDIDLNASGKTITFGANFAFKTKTLKWIAGTINITTNNSILTIDNTATITNSTFSAHWGGLLTLSAGGTSNDVFGVIM